MPRAEPRPGASPDPGPRPPTGSRRGGGAIAGAAAVGVVAGVLSGLFGVGGGILIVPGLVLLLGMDQRRAHGTSLAAIVPVAASAVVGFAVSGSVDWPAAAPLAVGAVAGAVAGTRALQRVPPGPLGIGFAALLLAAAARLLLTTPEAAGRGPLDALTVAALVAVGLFAGLLAGLFGVGGGVAIVPALIILFSVPDPVAKGTSLVVILPTAVAGTLRNLRFGNVDPAAAAATGLAGAAAAFLAARLALRMDPGLSSALFGGLLVVAAALLVRRIRDRARTAAPEP